jgi:hypothetical protein
MKGGWSLGHGKAMSLDDCHHHNRAKEREAVVFPAGELYGSASSFYLLPVNYADIRHLACPFPSNAPPLFSPLFLLFSTLPRTLLQTLLSLLPLLLQPFSSGSPP